MGVDCRIRLPAEVQLHHVAIATAIAAGAEWHTRPLGHGHDTLYVQVPSLEVKPSSIPELAQVRFTDGKGQERGFSYHFEFGDGSERGFMPRSTAYWIAIGKKVVDFFGGRLDYADCDADEDDYVVPKQPHIAGRVDEDWEALQARFQTIVPITEADLQANDEFAAYKLDELE